MNERPDWASILKVMYETRATVYNPGPIEPDTIEESPLSQHYDLYKQTDFSKSELEDILYYMEDTGLIAQFAEIEHNPKQHSKDGGAMKVYELTEKGFDVAHDIDSKEIQNLREQRRVRYQGTINRGIGILTVGLVVTNMLAVSSNAFGELNNLGGLPNPMMIFWSIILGNVILLIFIGVGIYSTFGRHDSK